MFGNVEERRSERLIIKTSIKYVEILMGKIVETEFP